MADVTNVQLGVCSVSYNGLDLGHTLGGVEVSLHYFHLMGILPTATQR
jgi:hypothetical protein